MDNNLNEEYSGYTKIPNEKVKVRLLKMHVAYIEKRILDEFTEKYNISDFNLWLKTELEKEFDIVIKNKFDIDTLTLILRKRYYENIAEWMKEKIRNELKKANNNLN